MAPTTRSKAAATRKTSARKARRDQKQPRQAVEPPTANLEPPRKRQRRINIKTESGVDDLPEEDGNSAEIPLLGVPEYKTDVSETAFFGSVEVGQDYISAIPAELLYNIFDYAVLDHDPERARKEHSAEYDFKPKPHALLGLAAMSRRFRALTEDFSRRYLTKHRKFYRFKTDAELLGQGRRRSARIEALGILPNRVYRMELVTVIRDRCIECGYYCADYAIMCNSVACHPECEKEAFPGKLMNLTDALREFDLRDYMLLKDRVPGPRAKHIDLPSIPYGTIWTRMGFGMSAGLSYRFNREDVEKIAGLVHGDVKAHMDQKLHERIVRFKKKRKALWISLKLRHHTDGLNRAKPRTSAWTYHKTELDIVAIHQREDDEDFDECIVHADYGNYDDIHERVCAVEPCEECEERKFLKYIPWLRCYLE